MDRNLTICSIFDRMWFISNFFLFQYTHIQEITCKLLSLVTEESIKYFRVEFGAEANHVSSKRHSKTELSRTTQFWHLSHGKSDYLGRIKDPPRPLSRTVATSLPVTATWKRFPRHVLRAAPPFDAWNVGNESNGETRFSFSMILTDINPMKILILPSQFSVLFYISTWTLQDKFS